MVPELTTLSNAIVPETGHRTPGPDSVTYDPTCDTQEPEKITALLMADDRINIDPVVSLAAETIFSSYITADHQEKQAPHMIEDMPTD